jgi:hypothetical protein
MSNRQSSGSGGPESPRELEAMLRAVTAHLDQATEQELGVANELRRRRREVLSGGRRGTSRFGATALAASALASAIVGIAIGLIIGRATVSPVLPLVALDEIEDAGDIVENLDFYNWLERQQLSGQPPSEAGS